MADTVRIGTYWTREEAGLAASVLQAAGIPAFVTGDDYGGWLPFQLGRFRACLLVSEKDAQNARRVLADYEQATTNIENERLKKKMTWAHRLLRLWLLFWLVSFTLNAIYAIYLLVF